MQFTLEPDDNERLASLCGQFDENLRHIERRLGVEIANRGNHFQIIGSAKPAQAAALIIHNLFDAAVNEIISPERVHLTLQESNLDSLLAVTEETQEEYPL